MWILAMSNPNDYYNMLAPVGSEGVLFKQSPAPDATPCNARQAWNTAQFNILLYQFMSAFFFSAIVEPVVLYCARYKMRNARDAELAIWGVEMSMLFYDLMHSFAGVSVVGLGTVIPGFSWSRFDGAATFNTWSAWILAAIRVAWLCGLSRDFAEDKSD
jgi:hypothetical protein